ncbi:MAG TPA: PQQ-binding-like beta-propeller repeat protein [Gemmataceae bacterium]|nr:PQQ-binding-like beta-propeller repeat protein [Gemmataceae bacterium]
MDEHQITDRVEGGRVEPGIMTQPAQTAATSPAARPAPPPRRRKWRLWMPLLLVVLWCGLLAFIRYGPLPDDAAMRNVSAQAAYALTLLLLGVWFVFFSGRPWPIRLAVGGSALLLIVGFLALFEVDGAWGDMWLHFRFRWGKPRELATLPGLATTGRDATIQPGDFTQFLGPDRNATVRGIRLDPDWAAHPPHELWRTTDVGAGWGAFAVAGDLAITQEQRDREEVIVARDRKTGKPVWSHANTVRFVDTTHMGGDGPRATPTIASFPNGSLGTRVFAHGSTGILDCLDASTGQLLWSQDTLGKSSEGNIQWGVSASPLVIEKLGLVVISLGSGGADGTLAAYDVKTGDRKWVAGADMASYASPMLATLGGKEQIVMINDQSVTGHDPADGKVLWDYKWKQTPAKASQPPVLPGDRLLLTADYGAPGVLLHVKHDGDQWTTEEIWTTQHMRTKFTTPVVRGHYAYGLDDDALACIDLDDGGKQVWRAPRTDHAGFGQVLLVEDLLIVQAERGDVELVKVDPSGYQKLGALHAFGGKTWNNPALAGNQLFVRNDQEAACYELTAIPTAAAK